MTINVIARLHIYALLCLLPHCKVHLQHSYHSDCASVRYKVLIDMATITARTPAALRTPCTAASRARPARVAQPITARCRPFFGPSPGAFYRTSGGWSDGSAAAMNDIMNAMGNQWRAQAGARTGSGYVYGSGRCRTRNFNNTTSDPFQQQQQQYQSAPQLPLDVAETPEGFYTIYADVPGLSKPDLSIRLSKDRVLTVSGYRKAPFSTDSSSTEAAGASYKQMERRFGGFERQWELPADAMAEGISAKVADGVLTMSVPRKQPEPETDGVQDIFIA